jgi:TPR repeat protein
MIKIYKNLLLIVIHLIILEKNSLVAHDGSSSPQVEVRGIENNSTMIVEGDVNTTTNVFQGGTHHHYDQQPKQTRPPPKRFGLFNCNRGIFPKSLKTDDAFVERKIDGESYLQVIANHLRVSQGFPSYTVLCALDGTAGVGKTTLAIEYAWEHLKSDYKSVFWLDASSESTLRTAYIFLLETLQADLPAEYQQFSKSDLDPYVMSALSNSTPESRWLIICDNVENKNLVEPLLSSSGGHIILTSRLHNAWPASRTINVGILQEPEALELLEKTSGIKISEVNEVQAKKLINTCLERLALAITQAGSYMRQSYETGENILFEGYIQHFEDASKRIELLLHAPKLLDDDPRKKTIMTTWKITEERLSERAKRLMNYFSYLAPEMIPMSLFYGDQKEEIRKAVGEIVSYSMITRQDDYISIHRLSQLVRRLELQRDQATPLLVLEEILGVWSTSWLKELGKERDCGEHERSAFAKLYEQASVLLPHVVEIEGHLTQITSPEHADKKFGLQLLFGYLENTQRMAASESREIVLNPKKILVSIKEREQSPGIDYPKIIQRDLRITKEEYTHLLNQAEQMECPPETWEEKRQLLKMLHEAKELAQSISTQFNFLTSKDRLHYGDILEKVVSVEDIYRYKVISLTNRLRQKSILARDDCDKIIEAVNILVTTMADDRLDFVITAISSFISDKMINEDRAKIINALGAVDYEHLPQVVSTIEKLIQDKSKNIKDRVKVITSISSIHPACFDKAIRTIDSLISKDMNFSLQASIIHAVTCVKEEYLDSILSIISLLIKEEIIDWDDAEFLESIGELEEHHRIHILSAVLPFFKKITDNTSRLNIMKLAQCVNFFCLKEMIDFINTLIESESIVYGRFNWNSQQLMEALIDAYPQHIDRVIEETHHLLKVSDNKDRGDVIKEITKHLQKNSVRRREFSLDDLNKLEKTQFKKKTLILSRQELNDIHKLIEPLIKGYIDKEVRFKMIEEIAKVQEDHRKKAVDLVSSFLEQSATHPLSVIYRDGDLHILITEAAKILNSAEKITPKKETNPIRDKSVIKSPPDASQVSQSQQNFPYNFGEISYNIGWKYQNEGSAPDDSRAAKWYKKAVEKKHAEACCELALMYEEGIGEKKDYEQAFTLCQLSENLSSKRGQRHLGRLYALGRGTTINREEAEKLLRQCNHPSGWYNLGVLYDILNYSEKAIECYAKGRSSLEEAEDSLRVVSMRGFPLKDGIFNRLLSHLSRNATAFYFEDNQLTVDDLSLLLSHLPQNLDTLGLTNNDVGDRGAQALANSLKTLSCPLRHLILRSDHITDEGAMLLLKELLDNPHIQTLDLRDNPITDKIKAQLKDLASKKKGLRLILSPQLEKDPISQEQDSDENIKVTPEEVKKFLFTLKLLIGEKIGVEELNELKTLASSDDDVKMILADIYQKGRGEYEKYSHTTYEEEIKWLEEAAKNGKVEALTQLGINHEYGRGTPKNLDKANNFYKQAAEKGDAGACRFLGINYQKGIGLTRDIDQANYYFQEAINRGDNLSVKLLRNLILSQEAAVDFNQGIFQEMNDLEKFIYEIQNAINKKQKLSEENLRKLKELAQVDESFKVRIIELYNAGCGEYPLGSIETQQEEAEWLEKVEDAEVLFNLGTKYLEGDDLTLDESKAVICWEKAASQNYSPAKANLAWMYVTGRGGVKDENQALKLWQEISDITSVGSEAALIYLGWMHAKGMGGLEKNFVKAVELLLKGSSFSETREERAAAKYALAHIIKENREIHFSVNETAENILQEVARAGYLQALYELDEQKALENLEEKIEEYKQEALRGDAVSRTNLGWLYEHSIGLNYNKEEALRLYGLAGSNGDFIADYNYLRLSSKNDTIENHDITIANKASSSIEGADSSILVERPQIKKEESGCCAGCIAQ